MEPVLIVVLVTVVQTLYMADRLPEGCWFGDPYIRDECRAEGERILRRLVVKRNALLSVGDELHRGGGLRAIKIHLEPVSRFYKLQT